MDHEAFSESDFRLLGLKPGSNPSEVRQAYRTLVKKWHPDRHYTKPYETRALAEKKFREIDQAYRRIARSWAKTPRYVKSTPPASHRSTAQAERSATTQAREAPVFRSRPGIAFRSFFRGKIILPALLLAAAVFFFTQIPSFLPDTQDATETHAPQVAKNPAGDKSPGIQEPSEAASPPASANLSPPPRGFVPSPPPASTGGAERFFHPGLDSFRSAENSGRSLPGPGPDLDLRPF